MEQPKNRSPIDFSNMVPLGVGVLSLFGICLLLVAGRLFSPRSTVLPVDTATPFKYLLLGTEPGISSAVPSVDPLFPEETSEIIPGVSTSDGTIEDIPGQSTPEILVTATRKAGFSITAVSGLSTSVSSNPTQKIPTGLSTDDPIIIFPSTKKSTSTPFPLVPTKTQTLTFTPRPTSTSSSLTKTPRPLFTTTSTSTLPVANNTPTRTSTSVSTAPLNPGTYDDTDAHLAYSGNWTAQTGVLEAFNLTLHVSTTLGNSMTFRFIGQELRIFYQSGPSLGKLRVVIDGQEFELDQFDESSFTSEWVSATVPNGTHTVVIRHAEGGSVNLDQIIIPDVIPTATSTPR